ncbi:MAG: hypothetical protein GY749_32085 [Desulfobacteraceae bacterium]|nr:hypothetical protein [Desulfobacteraceae bacterium]
MAKISAGEFDILSDFIYRKTGIRFESKKLYFISKRIGKRMDELGIETVNEYIRMLRFADPVNQEFNQKNSLWVRFWQSRQQIPHENSEVPQQNSQLYPLP